MAGFLALLHIRQAFPSQAVYTTFMTVAMICRRFREPALRQALNRGLQLRVQLRNLTGFPFTARGGIPQGSTMTSKVQR